MEPQDCICGYPCDVVLESGALSGAEDLTACLSITAGSELTIAYPAWITLTAGTTILLEDGFTLPDGCELSLEIDSQLYCDLLIDADGDLVNACFDCDDGDPTTYPGADEACDGKDNNCNGAVDEDFFGDSSNGGIDFNDSWPGPTLEAYPVSIGGTVNGRILPLADEDWFAIAATEDVDDFCVLDSQDDPITATVNITSPSPELYTLCACWSSATNLCAKSSQVCTSSSGTPSEDLTIKMDMDCGSTDVGWLDIRVQPSDAAVDHSCDEYGVSWSITELAQ